MLAILVGLAALLALVVLAGNVAGMPAPELLPEDGVVGAYGPVGLTFAESVPKDLESKASLFSQTGGPALAARWTRQGKTAWLWPERLEAGDQYILRLEAGAQDLHGRVLREALQWEIGVRSPAVVYLGKVEVPDLWRSGVGGEDRRQITFTGGKVFDFSIARQGEHIAYSAVNSQAGLDLWETGRDGGEPRLLVACGADRCAEPTYMSNGAYLAYTRTQASGIGSYHPAEVWGLDLNSLETRRLAAGQGPVVGNLIGSPDGKFLAFYDEGAPVQNAVAMGGIWVVPIESEEGFVLPSTGGAPGSWSPDGHQLWFVGADLSGEELITRLWVAEIGAGSHAVAPVGWENVNLNHFGRPVWSPDGRWITFAASEAGSGAGSRLWRFSPDGSERQGLAREPFYSYGHYSWDPGSSMLVFQRLEQGVPDARPEVAVWRAGEIILIAQDAALPAWMP